MDDTYNSTKQDFLLLPYSHILPVSSSLSTSPKQLPMEENVMHSHYQQVTPLKRNVGKHPQWRGTDLSKKMEVPDIATLISLTSVQTVKF
jgi:hypothetical protein